MFSISPSFADCREPPAKPTREHGYVSASTENDELTLLSDIMQEGRIEYRQTHPFDFSKIKLFIYLFLVNVNVNLLLQPI